MCMSQVKPLATAFTSLSFCVSGINIIMSDEVTNRDAMGNRGMFGRSTHIFALISLHKVQ